MSWYDDWPDWLKQLVTGASLGIISDQPYVDQQQAEKGKGTYGNIGPDLRAKARDILQDQNKGPAPAGTAAIPKPKTLEEAQRESVKSTNSLDQKVRDAQGAKTNALIGNGAIGGVSPNAPVYDHTIRRKPTQIGDKTEFAPKRNDSTVTRTLSDVAFDPYDWSDEKVKQVAKLMVDAGHPNAKTGDRKVIAGIWADYAATSALMYFKGHKVNPMELLKKQSFGLGAGIGGRAGPKTVTSTDTRYLQTNATSARQLAQEALSARLGRDATDDEVGEFIKARRAEEKKNPTVSTTTTTTSADGTSQTSKSNVKEGFQAVDFAKQYMLDYDSEEAKAYQAAGIMMPWFFEALSGPV